MNGSCRRSRRSRNHQSPHPSTESGQLQTAFLNAANDAPILLARLVAAADAMGLGCCPVSAIRNEAEAASRLLGLPGRLFPCASLALGWPADERVLSPRLPLGATLHTDRFDDAGLPGHVADADRHRVEQKPFAKQRFAAELGAAGPYS